MNAMHTFVSPLFVTSESGMLHKPKPDPKPKQVLGPKKQLHERFVKKKIADTHKVRRNVEDVPEHP
jgi:hypothetical protein